jgi:hypothetical protein
MMDGLASLAVWGRPDREQATLQQGQGFKCPHAITRMAGTEVSHLVKLNKQGFHQR